jgi:hypothetical protein
MLLRVNGETAGRRSSRWVSLWGPGCMLGASAAWYPLILITAGLNWDGIGVRPLILLVTYEAARVSLR